MPAHSHVPSISISVPPIHTSVVDIESIEKYIYIMIFHAFLFLEILLVVSAVLPYGHHGQLPRGPMRIGGHANLYMLCTVCLFND